MILILKTDEAGGTTITIDGRLVRDYIAPVEHSINEASAQQKAVHLFLRDVSQIDEDGRKLLSRLAAKGVQLRALGIYSSYVVAETLRETPPKSSAPTS